MPVENPPHPGGFVLRQCIEPLGLGITDAAALGVTRTTLSELVNEKRGISPEMAVRLSGVFRGQRRKLACAAGAARYSARCDGGSAPGAGAPVEPCCLANGPS
jgi:addiction module HigA family antidote